MNYTHFLAGFFSSIFCLALFSLCSCNSERETEDRNLIRESRRFYPVVTGLYRDYRVDSIMFRELGTVKDTISSLMRFELAELRAVETSDSIYDLKIWHRRSSDHVWQHVATWAVETNTERLIVNEGNARFIKLIFPLRPAMSFNANIFINENLITEVAGEMISIYRDWGQSRVIATDLSMEVSGILFDQVAHIRLANSETLLSLREVQEYYAKDVGLIRKSMHILDTQKFGSTDPWEIKGERGFIMEMNLIDYN
jgi:hypothetical protein